MCDLKNIPNKIRLNLYNLVAMLCYIGNNDYIEGGPTMRGIIKFEVYFDGVALESDIPIPKTMIMFTEMPIFPLFIRFIALNV